MSIQYLPDGRLISLKDNLSQNEIEKEIELYLQNYPLEIQEEIIETDNQQIPVPNTVKPISEYTVKDYLGQVGFGYSGGINLGGNTIPEFEDVDKDIKEELLSYKQGDKEEGASFGKIAKNSLGIVENLANPLQDYADKVLELNEYEKELNNLSVKQNLSKEEQDRYKELELKINGSGKSKEEINQEVASSLGMGDMPPSAEAYYARQNLEEQLGLKELIRIEVERRKRLEQRQEEAPVSNATKYLFASAQDERAGGALGKAWDSYWNDLSKEQKFDALGDVVGMSAAPAALILGANFASALTLQRMPWMYQFLGAGAATGTTSGYITYGTSFDEYLVQSGLDLTNPESVLEVFQDKELIEEAKDYAMNRGLAVGSFDAISGGFATRMLAPAQINNKLLASIIRKPTGTDLGYLRRTGINIVAQSPLQTGLPMIGETIAQATTLKDNEKYSGFDIFAEGLGEIPFIGADATLGGILSSQMDSTRTKKERKQADLKQAEREYISVSSVSNDFGYGKITGEFVSIDEDTGIETTGLPYGKDVFTNYYSKEDSFNIFANTEEDIEAPNQFVAKSNNRGKFKIIDTYNNVIEDDIDSQNEAEEKSGTYNVYSGIRYSKYLKDSNLEIQNIPDSNLTSRISEFMLDPYESKIAIEEIKNDTFIFNQPQFNRILNAIGENTTEFNVLHLQKVLNVKDFDTLLNQKAEDLLFRKTNTMPPVRIKKKDITNLSEELNINIDFQSNGFKSLSLKLVGQSDYNKMNNAQKRYLYSFLKTLPVNETDNKNFPDMSRRDYSVKQKEQVIDSLIKNPKKTNLNDISLSLGLDPTVIENKRLASRVREDLVISGVINKTGSKYKFNPQGSWILSRQNQIDLNNDPTLQEDLNKTLRFQEFFENKLKELNLPDIITKLKQGIISVNGQKDQEALGVFNPSLKEIILSVASARENALAKNNKATEQDILNELTVTFGHETVHATKLLDLFSAQEWQNLTNATASTLVPRKTVEEVTGSKQAYSQYIQNLGRKPTYFDLQRDAYKNQEYDSAEEAQETVVEEAVALLLEDWFKNQIKLNGQSKGIANKTKDFFKAINNGLEYSGFQTYENIFNKLLSGKIGKRERVNQYSKPIPVTVRDEFGNVLSTYEQQPKVLRSSGINRYRNLSGAVGIDLDNDELIPSSMDEEIPIIERPLQDSPNLRFSLNNIQQRPTSLVIEFMRNAREATYGNDFSTIPAAILEKTMSSDINTIRRFGRKLNSQEFQDAQAQLYWYTQENLKQLGYKNGNDIATLYLVGNASKYNVLTTSQVEAESFANGLTQSPYSIKGDAKKITEYKVRRSDIILTTDIMFAKNPPAWADKNNFYITKPQALRGGGKNISYQEVKPIRKLKTGFNNGYSKSKFSLNKRNQISSMEFMRSKGTRGKQVSENLRTYSKPTERVGQATLEEKKLAKRFKLIPKENERLIYAAKTFEPKIIKEVGDFKIVKDDYLEGNLNVGKILDVDVELFRDPGGFEGENYSMVITDSRAIGDGNVGLYANNLKQAKLEAVWEIEKFVKESVLTDISGTRLYQVANNTKLYHFEDSPNVLNYLEDKSSYGLDEIEFKEGKEALLKAINSIDYQYDLLNHYAVTEGLRRMFAIEETAPSFKEKLGENWVTKKEYFLNREYINNGKTFKGYTKLLNLVQVKAESYSPNEVKNNRNAFIVLGAPASGKSFFSKEIAKENNLAILDSDDIKAFIPEYAGGVGANAVHQEAKVINQSVYENFLSEGKDMLLPRVGGKENFNQIKNTIKQLKNNDYNVNLVLVDVDTSNSLQRMLTRFAETGRLLPPSYLESIGNTPIDTYNRLQYEADQHAWIDNNGKPNQEIIRQNTGILPPSIGRERTNIRQRISEGSEAINDQIIAEQTTQEYIRDLDIAIEGVKTLNDESEKNNLVPKYNLNASQDALKVAFETAANKSTRTELSPEIKNKYSLKKGKPLNPNAESLIEHYQTVDNTPDKTFGEILLATADATRELSKDIRSGLVDQYSIFNKIEKEAAKVQGISEQKILANTSAYASMLLSDRSGEIWKGSFFEGFPVYDEKGYVRVEVISPKDNKPVVPPMKFLEPLMVNSQLLGLFTSVRNVEREINFDQQGRKVKTTKKQIAEAKQALKDYPILNKVSEEYNRWNEHLVDFLVATQVLDEATAKIWLQNSDYIPFYRSLSVDEKGQQVKTVGPQVLKGFSMSKNLFVEAKGSETKKTTDAITGIAQNLRAAIESGMKNVAANRSVRDLVSLGYAQQVGNNVKGKEVITIRVQGKNKSFNVSDKATYEAYLGFQDGFNPYTGGYTMQAAIGAKLLFSEVITRAPKFWAMQLSRDSISAWALLGIDEYTPFFTSLNNAAKITAGMITGRVPEGFTKMQRAGVVTRYDQGILQTQEDANIILKRAKRNAIKRSKNLTPEKVVSQLWDNSFMLAWNATGQGTLITDAATRLAVYESILKQTGNEAEAVFQSMEVMNFTRRGNNPMIQITTSLIPFSNPTMQGLDLFIRAITGKYGQTNLKKKERLRKLSLRLGSIMATTPLYYLAVKDTEEYKTTPPEIRAKNYIFPTKEWFGLDYTVRFPSAFEVGFATKEIPEALLRYFDSTDSGKIAIKNILSSAEDTILGPINPLKITALAPIAENYFNRDSFTKGPIVPERMRAGELDYLKDRPSTPSIYKSIGKLTNTSPLMIRNLSEGYFAYLGTYAATLYDTAKDIGPSTGWEKSLFTQGFVLPPEQKGYVKHFYDMKKILDDYFADAQRVMDKEEFLLNNPYDDKYDDDFTIQMKTLQKELNLRGELIKAYNEDKEAIYSSNVYDADEKRDKIETIDRIINKELKGIDQERFNLEKQLRER